MANKKFFVNVDVQSNDVVNLKADTLDITSNLASANPKRIVYWSGQYYYSNGTSWILLSNEQSVTSVGLTMPSAFTVTNSPITSSGDIAVTGAGLASQYVRGDGSLASFPDIAGGGGGQVFYFNGGTYQGTIGGAAFEQLSAAAVIGTGVDFTSGSVNDVAFANFITDVGKPTQETIPAGVWIFQVYLSASSTSTCEIYATVEIYDGTSFTVLSTSLHEVITNGTAIDLYTFTCAVPQYDPLTPTDRVVIRFYPTNLGGSRTVTLHTQDSHLGSVQTTFTTGLASLNGLTAAAQYLQTGTEGTDFNINTSGVDTHVFNLPTATALIRGALSSTDWSTFNNKQDALTLTTNGYSGLATFGGTILNIPDYGGFIPKLEGDETFRGVNYSNNSTTEVTSGGVVIVTTGTSTARSVTSTNYATKQIRKGFTASVVSGGRYTGTRGSALLFFIGGGFKYVCDFYISDTAFASGCRQFYGMAGQTTDLAYSDTVLVSSLTNIIGVGSDALDTNLQLFHNDATGTATKIDLGINFPANRTAGLALTTVYGVVLYNENNGDIKYSVENKETGAIATGTISTNLPLGTQGLNFFASRCMGSGGGVTNSGQFDLTILGVYSL